MKLTRKLFDIASIVGYAPIAQNTEEIERVYCTIIRHVSKFQSQEFKIVMPDIDAKLRKRKGS